MSPADDSLQSPPMRRLRLHHYIIFAMLLGAGVGLPLNYLAEKGRVPVEWPRNIAFYGKSVGDLFIRLLSMTIVPLIVTSMVSGVSGTGSLKGLGRIGARTLAYFMGTTVLAIILSLILFNTIRPGVGADLDALRSGAETVTPPAIDTSGGVGNAVWNLLLNIIPTNPFAVMADPTNRSILGVIFFSLLFGIFITVVGGEAGQLLSRVFSAAFEVMMKLTMAVIWTAPVGVCGFMLYASAGRGLAVFVPLGWWVFTVFIGLFIHTFILLPICVWLFAKRSPWEFFKACQPAILMAFSTSSSNATLPVTMTSVEQRAGISNRISSFVLPLGATINMNGTALYETAAALFIAQAYGIHLTLIDQAVVALTALLAAVGSAGIPHAGIVMMAVVFGAVGLPLDGIGLILAVDRVLDMCRTVTNVWGDMTACAVVARYESDPD